MIDSNFLNRNAHIGAKNHLKFDVVRKQRHLLIIANRNRLSNYEPKKI